MRRIYIALFGLIALAETARAANALNPFNPNGSLSQGYAVLYGQDATGAFVPVIVGPGGGISVGGGRLVSAGAQQTLVLTSSAQSLTVPSGATIADISSEGTSGANNECFRYRDDGTAPTATVGSGKAAQQDILGYSGPLSAIQFILATGAACTLTINYYK